MKPFGLKLLLAASLLVNAGVLAAAWTSGWRAASPVERALFGTAHDEIPDRLGLDPAQRQRWHAMESGFVKSLQDAGREIQAHRERMIREIMSARPDAEAIERERGAIFALQQAQQRAVIAQLLEERDLLRPEQREALADLLLAQGAVHGIEAGPGK